MTRTPKPDWIDGYAKYKDLVRSWGFEVLDVSDSGDYQGDYTVLLADGARRGFTTFGYGSCSGCDILEDVAPWGDGEGDDWAGVVELRDKMRDEIVWRDSAAELADYLEERDAANHWWMNDSFMRGSIQGYITTLRA